MKRRRPPLSPAERAFRHFRKRLGQRICANMDARALWKEIIADIESGEPAQMRFLGRSSQKHRRLWGFDLNGTEIVVVYDHDLCCPITIITDAVVGRNLQHGYVYLKTGIYK